MTKPDTLTRQQRRFVAALLTARTVAEAAQAVGVTERTGLRYLAHPAVKRALSEALLRGEKRAQRKQAKRKSTREESGEKIPPSV
jgi:phage terminase small subunit